MPRGRGPPSRPHTSACSGRWCASGRSRRRSPQPLRWRSSGRREAGFCSSCCSFGLSTPAPIALGSLSASGSSSRTSPRRRATGVSSGAWSPRRPWPSRDCGLSVSRRFWVSCSGRSSVPSHRPETWPNRFSNGQRARRTPAGSSPGTGAYLIAWIRSSSRRPLPRSS